MKKDFGPVSPELQAKLQACDLEVQQFLLKLIAENSALQKRIVSVEVKNISLNERVKALETKLKKIPTTILEREAELEILRIAQEIIDKSRQKGPTEFH